MVRRLSLPYPSLEIIPTPAIVEWEWLSKQIGSRLASGISVCLVAEHGHDLRGGYFFHIRRVENGFEFLDFDGRLSLSLSTSAECVAFINHATGRAFDDDMWARCRLLNLRVDDVS